MADDAKISPYSLSDCKNTTDDALQNYLNSLKFQQSHYLTDVKLALGYAAVVISAITFAYDYKLGFDNTKYYTTGTVLIYFALNSAFTYWLYFVEKNTIFTGTARGGKIALSSSTKKFDPTYRLKVRYTASQSSDQWKEIEITAPFQQWFTRDGRFVAAPFQQWLASSVSFIGEADPKNAGARSADASGTAASSAVQGSDISSSPKVAPSSKKRKG